VTRTWRRIGLACCLALALGVLASSAVAGTAANGSEAAIPTSSIVGAGYDEFVFASEISSTVQVGCNFCGVIDACLDKHPNEACRIYEGHQCRCKNCNGFSLECYW
jgi:hypothetical protein